MWPKDKKIQDEISLANSTSVFAVGLEVIGNIVALSDIRIEGKVKGNVRTKKKAVIGSTGKVTGDINAQEICVMGEFYGDMYITGLAKFGSTAKVIGTVVSASIDIDEGADMEVTLKKVKLDKPNLRNLEQFRASNYKFGRKPAIGPLFLEKVKGNIRVLQDESRD